MHVVGDYPRHAQSCGERAQLPDQRALLGEPMIPALDGQLGAEDIAQLTGGGPGEVGAPLGEQLRQPASGTAGECGDPLHVPGDKCPGDAGATALTVHTGPGDERGNVVVAGVRFGEQHQMRAPLAATSGELRHAHRELGPQDARECQGRAGGAEAHHAPHLVVIGEGEGPVTQCRRPFGERLGERGAVEQRESGMTVEFGVRGTGHHTEYTPKHDGAREGR